MTNNKYVDSYRSKHRALGKCIYCPRQVEKGNKNYCKHHIEITNEKRRIKYRYNLIKNPTTISA